MTTDMQALTTLREVLLPLTSLPPPEIAALAWLELPGHQPPWQRTGLQVRRGQQFTLFAAGRIYWSARHPDRHGGPSFHLWARVAPGGRIVNLAATSGTFTADISGELELGIYMGVWRDRFGTLGTGHELYARLSGKLGCWAVIWNNSALDALARLKGECANTFITAEHTRLQTPYESPTGWEYLLETGFAEIFHGSAQGIRVDAADAQGILTYPIDVPLDDSTRLTWRWRADELPSDLAEDSVHTHDYVSIGTEFDNGRDLTWIWSAALAPDTHFHCPTRAWTARETHYVVRRGNAQPGTWFTESRWVRADVARAMGEPPQRIVRVWLIALASFQHRRARAEFAEIELEHANGRVRVL